MGQNWGSWTSWTPVLTASTTAPTMGTGSTARGGWTQQGTIVHWWAQFVFGTSPVAGSGYYQLALPSNPFPSGTFRSGTGSLSTRRTRRRCTR